MSAIPKMPPSTWLPWDGLQLSQRDPLGMRWCLCTSFTPSTCTYSSPDPQAPGPGVYNEAQAQSDWRRTCPAAHAFPLSSVWASSFLLILILIYTWIVLKRHSLSEAKCLTLDKTNGSHHFEYKPPAYCEAGFLMWLGSEESRSRWILGGVNATMCEPTWSHVMEGKVYVGLEPDDLSSNVASLFPSFATWGSSWLLRAAVSCL